MELSDNAMTLLQDRYLMKDERGEVIETPEDMFKRVAKNIAQADKLYNATKKQINQTVKEFYNVMEELKFLPNSPTLFNAGRKFQQLSACFVLPVPDSMEGIFRAIYNMAMIQRSGGGTGFSFSNLRPKSDVVTSSMGQSSGPVAFLQAFDAATDTIKQGGMRRGANMGIMKVSHPDIEEFIEIKSVEGTIPNFNLSIGITDEFMQKVRSGEKFALRNPRNGQVANYIDAKQLLDKIALSAWKTGEPGVVFLDKINDDNPLPELGEIEATNPCGEQPLLSYESCCLGSINLSKFFKDGEVDFDELARVVHIAVHFLDNIIDMNKYPIPEIEDATIANRKIGLGVMGFADLLVKLDIPYNSTGAIHLAIKIMDFINSEAQDASCLLAQERGPFPTVEKSIYSDWDEPPRNATRTTIAPTGSLSRIAGCSSGIEPYFALAYKSYILDKELSELNPLLEDKMKKMGIKLDTAELIANRGNIQEMDVPDDIKKVFRTAHDIPPKDHVMIQAAFQENVDNAVSKTINLPNQATVEEVLDAYMLAWEQGCKGITVYRDGSRQVQVLSSSAPKDRPEDLKGITKKMQTGCGSLYVTINAYDGKVFEIFANIGKSGGCAIANTEALCRVVSIGLRTGISIDSIVKQLRGIRCPSPSIQKRPILSCPDAIGQALQEFTKFKVQEKVGGNCPSCGGQIIFEEGCTKCLSCSYTRCG